MKGFASGVGGVCICMVAIMGTVLCGFALGGEETETTTTKWNLTADTTGLFDTSDAPAFTTYNPAANWTGYKASRGTGEGMGGIEYSTSAKINSYPIPMDQEETSMPTWFKLTNTTGYADPPGIANPTGYPQSDYINTVLISDDIVALVSQTTYISNPRVVTVQQVTDGPASTAKYYPKVIYDLTNSGTRAYAIPMSAWHMESVRVNPDGAWAQYRNYMMAPLEMYSNIKTLEVTFETQEVLAKDPDGNIVFRGSMGDVTIAYCQPSVSDPYLDTKWEGVDEPAQVISWYGVEDVGSQAYMDVSKGVVPTGQASISETYWANGYQNGKIDILIRWNSNTSSTRSYISVATMVDVAESDGTTSLMDIHTNIDYQNSKIKLETFNYSLSKPVVSSYYAGNFTKGVLLSLDMYGDALKIYAVDTFRSFQDYTLLAEPIISLDRFYSDISGRSSTFGPGKLTASSLLLGSGTESTRVTMGIVDTSVYMGDSTLIMAEPDIKPSDYWPEMEAWELRLYSFAIEGWGMSVRNSDYIMAAWLVDDGKITINDQAHELTNFWIRAVHNTSTDKWDLYVVFGSETPLKPIYIMSATGDSPEISLYGNWYFQSSIYEGSEVTTSQYVFDFQHFIFNSNAAILAYMGLLIMGSIVAKRMGGLGVYDMIVLVFAGICGFVLMV